MDEDGGVRRRWMKMVACMLEEDGGMYKVKEDEDGVDDSRETRKDNVYAR
jgi:hypothetical protein